MGSPEAQAPRERTDASDIKAMVDVFRILLQWDAEDRAKGLNDDFRTGAESAPVE